MNTYQRILGYSPSLASRLAKFFLYSLLGTVFSTSYIALIIPMLQVLFYSQPDAQVPPLPDFSFTLDFAKQSVTHYYVKLIAEHGRAVTLGYICGFIVCLVFFANVLRYMERMIASRIKVDIVKNMRVHIFDNVSKLHIGYFNDQRKGDLMSRFTNDMSEVEVTVMNSLKSVLREPITIIFYLVAMFVISYKLALFTLILLPVLGGVIGELVKRLKRKAKQSQEAMGRIVNILDETFSSMRVIKAFNARDFVVSKMVKETTYHRKTNLSIARKNELSSPVSEFLGVIVVAIIMYYGGNLILSGNNELQAPEFLTFLVYFASMIQPAKNFSNGITSLQKGTVAAGRIFSVVDLKPAIANKPNAIDLKEFKDSIEFENVSFAYDKDHVLKDINLRIEKGKSIALVGPSGGGKSTLADLVPRFYDPKSGHVKIDGISLTDYDVESLRKHMGVVTQESILFNDTIFNNIAFGMTDAKEEDVINAAKVANAHEFIIQMENGYQSLIGERGSKLSGGQRQRLAIARAVLKNPPILILDEATSALDSESEKLVQDALAKLMMNRTSLVIAHRLSTIQHADEIIVIQGGRILERGRHDDLILKDGLYRKLSEIQKQ